MGNCKKACTNGLAWGIMGLIATGPAAVICLFSCFCADTCMSGFWGKCMSFLAIGALVFACMAWIIAPSVMAGECSDLNKGFIFNGMTVIRELGISWSQICELVGLGFCGVATLCYLIFYCL